MSARQDGVAIYWSRFRDNITRSAAANFRYAKPHLPTLALFGVIGEPAYYFWWRIAQPESYESLAMRVVAGALCVPLTSRRLLDRFETQMTFYFCFAVGFCLPFFFCFLLLKNAHLAGDFGETPIQSPMQYSVALVLLVLLLPRGLLAALVYVVSTTLAWGLFIATTVNPISGEVTTLFWGLMPVYVFILLTGTLFNRNREIIDQEKLRAVASVGSTIAHELRTPLLGIRALAEGIQLHLSKLIEAYELAQQRGLVKPLRAGHALHLRTSLDQIGREIEQSNGIIDMLLINSTEKPLQGVAFEEFSAAKCVREAIARYPFNAAAERRLIVTNLEDDFRIHAPRILVVHVLFNLIKNAVYYVNKAGKGDIRLELKQQDRSNVILVEDTGTGISPDNIKRIFERFFTTTETGQGAGIGLSFCKMVLEGVGGSVSCESEIGHFTRFRLSFPKIRHA